MALRANPEERERLIAALGRDRRLSIVGTDGYIALNAYLPPNARLGANENAFLGGFRLWDPARSSLAS